MIPSEFIYVRHEAIKRGRHWDLRFQLPNSKNWASFAFNDFPPTEPGKRIYIVRTNDHSRKEALFTGTIPEGSYGAGKLIGVDKGKCEIIKYTNAHIIINFKGDKLKGIYHFVNTASWGRARGNYRQKVYAFFMAKDQVSEQYELLE